jgi:hypothetical protein
MLRDKNGHAVSDSDGQSGARGGHVPFSKRLIAQRQ